MTNLAEFERLEILRGLKVLDTPSDARLDAITILAKMYFDVPIALVSLVDECRQWFKSRQGLAATETHRDLAFCHHAIQQTEPMVVQDALLDERFASNDLVTGEPFVRFYAGAPIIIEGFPIGTLCIIDSKPRNLSTEDIEKLASVAEMAASFLSSYRDNNFAEFLNKDAVSWERDEALKQASEARRSRYESSEFLNRILETIPAVVYVRDEKFNIVRGSSAFFNVFPEEHREKIIGTNGFDFVSEEMASIVRTEDTRAFEHGSAESTYEVVLPTGKSGTFYTKRIRFEDIAGRKFVVAISQDVSKVTETEKAVLHAKEFQDLMFEHMPDIVFVKDDQFRLIQANQKMLELYPEEVRGSVIGTTTIEQYNEEERNAFLKEDRRALEEGFSEVEETLDFPDGVRRTLLTRKVRFEDQENQPYILGISRDITELVDAHKQLESSLGLLDGVLNTVSSAVIGLNSKKEVVSINRAGLKMLAKKNAGVPFTWPNDIEFLDLEDMHALQLSANPIARALAGAKIDGEVHIMHSSTRDLELYVRVSSARVRSKTSPLHTVIVLEDVSEAERNRQSAERQSRLDALGQLTGGIAHDFNNLLNTMQYAIELLRREELSERGQRSANAAIKSIRRGSELTDRLLAFAKKQPARSTTRALQEVVVELKELVTPVIETSIVIDFASIDEDLHVYCDQGQLQNAILNLVMNSRDAILSSKKGNSIKIDFRPIDGLPAETEGNNTGPETGARLVSSTDDKRYIEVTVTDNGPGMPDSVAARAVDPFFTTKDVHSGTGLGLSMVYGFVNQSDGEMQIDTEEGKGTTVRIFLPRGDSSSENGASAEVDPIIEGKGETVLIVEDEESLLEQLNELLKELNYSTVQARSGQAALDMLKAGLSVDLILTDIVMPGGIGGFELARLARGIDPNMPIIYMSGYTGFSDEEMGDVVAPLLTKPSSPSITSIKMRSVLDKVA